MLGEVLREVSVLAAPFAPFVAEDVYLGVSPGSESVHLETWRNTSELAKEDVALLSAMTEVRRVVSRALEQRALHGIKIRQPLAKVTIGSTTLQKVDASLIEIIADELNVKVVECTDEVDVIVFDTELTPELRAEGAVRDIVRMIQQQRKEKGLTPGDRIHVRIGGDKTLHAYEHHIKSETSADAIEWEGVEGVEIL